MPALFRPLDAGPLIANGGLTPERPAAIVAEGGAVGFGRPFRAHPGPPARIRAGGPRNAPRSIGVQGGDDTGSIASPTLAAGQASRAG